MEFLPFLIFIALLIYFIFNRIEQKNKENFEEILKEPIISLVIGFKTDSILFSIRALILIPF